MADAVQGAKRKAKLQAPQAVATPRRRTLLVAAALAPIAISQSAGAQMPALPLIAFLGFTAPAPDIVAAFLAGLAEGGFVGGRNVRVETRWAHSQRERLPALMTELMQLQPAVIATVGGSGTALAAKNATTSIPIVFEVGADPILTGLVTSLSRPEGNLTGVHVMTENLNAKRMELLHQMLPRAATIAALVNTGARSANAIEKEVRAAAVALRVKLELVFAANAQEIDTAFAIIADKGIGALVVTNSPFFNSRREQLVALATRARLAAVFEWREFVTAGGLMSYGSNYLLSLRECGVYTARVLRGAKPADLPVLQPRRFELVINGKTARALSLTIPQSLLLQANEVIE